MRYLIENIPIPVEPSFISQLATQLNLPFSGLIEGSSPNIIVGATRELTESELTSLRAAIKDTITAKTGLVTKL